MCGTSRAKEFVYQHIPLHNSKAWLTTSMKFSTLNESRAALIVRYLYFVTVTVGTVSLFRLNILMEIYRHGPGMPWYHFRTSYRSSSVVHSLWLIWSILFRGKLSLYSYGICELTTRLVFSLVLPYILHSPSLVCTVLWLYRLPLTRISLQSYRWTHVTH